MKSFRTEIDGFTICEDFNSKGFYRLRILLGKKHLYVEMNPEQSSFPPLFVGLGFLKED